MPSLLEILKDPNYVNANSATKTAIFDKYSTQDSNYTEANDATKAAIRSKFGIGSAVASEVASGKPADARKPEDVGFFEGLGAATKKGFSALGEAASGIGLAGASVLGSEEATAKRMADIKAANVEEGKGTRTLTASDIQRIAEERGLVKAGSQVPAYIAEQILQSAPSMAIPLAVGAGAAALSGPLAPIVGPVAGIAAYGVQQFGNFLARQAQEKDDPKELEVAKAALTAAGTAPIGYFADRFTVGLSNIGTKKAMSEVYAELGKRGAMREVGKRAAKGAGIGIIAEAPTEVLESVAERYQAGLELGGADAMNEYKESFFGAAAAGGGIGAGAKAAGAYKDYRQAVRVEDSLGQVRSDKNAFDESEEADGTDRRYNQQGVLIPDEQEAGQSDTGTNDAGLGDLEGNQLPPGSTGVGEENVDTALTDKIKQAQAYIRELKDVDPNDPRIEDAVAYIQQLQNPESFNAPGKQQGFDFTPADETTQRAIDTEMTETPGFALAQQTGAAALPRDEVTQIEEAPEAPKAKMMLIGEGANPLAPVTSFLKGLKPASLVPKQVADFNTELRNLIEDMSEFIGQSTKKVSRFAEEGMPSPGEGPDVSVPLDPQQRAMRLNALDNFFNSLSNAPVEQEALTSSLSQRMAGMNADSQATILKELTNMPAVNTVRGIRELRNKFADALTKFEGEQISEPVEKAAVIKPDEQANTLAKRAINILKNIPESMRTAEEKAAAVYFGRWSFSMGMRSAAFDLGSKPNKLITGPVFKGQTKSQAELFQKWVEDNLSQEDVAKFNATVEDYKAQTTKAEDFEKKAEEMSKMGGAARRYGQIVGRAPTGKVGGGDGFKSEAGLGKDKKPSTVSQLEASRFYPMHPAMQQAIEEGNLDAALSILEQSGDKFHSGLATKLRGLGLQTAVVFDRQNVLAAQILDAKIAEQRKDVFSLVQAVSPDVHAKYFADPNNFSLIRQGLNTLTDSNIEGQVSQLKEAYDGAIAMLESSGTYVQGLDVVNLNRAMGGASNYTFIHELVHAATVYSLSDANFDSLTKPQQAAVLELKKLYEFTKRTGLDEYGFTSVEEFVAEAFSNSDFQKLLKAIPYKADSNQSLWDKFTELVAKVFGMDNVLGYTLANANVILQAPPALTQPVANFNAKKKSVLAGTMPTSPKFVKFLDKAFEGKSAWQQVKGNMPYVLQNLGDTFRKHALGALTLRQLNDLAGSQISEFRRFINTSERMLDECNKVLFEVKGISDKWRLYQSKYQKKADTLAKLMIDSTRMGIDPNNKTGIPVLDNAWVEIGPEGHAIYNEARKFYKDRMDAYIESVIDAKKSTYRTTFDEDTALYKQESKDIEKEADVQKLRAYFKQHTMPVYFPLRRFGQYSLLVGKGANKEFYMFESAAERNAFTRELVAERKAAGRPVADSDLIQRNSIQDLTADNLQDFKYYKELQDLIDSGKAQNNKDLKDELKNKIEQLYFMMQPDKSVRKMMLNRKDVAGMSQDMLRAFESTSTHIAYQHSRYKYAPILHNLIDIADKNVRQKGLEGTIDSDYVNELRERLKLFMNPPEANALTTNATSVSFLWYMSAPASALVNMLGVPAIGLPVLAARYKFGPSSVKIAEYVKKFSSTGFKDQLGQAAFPSLSNKPGVLNDLQRRAFDALVASGLFDMTLTHDILEKANSPSTLDQGIFQRAMGIVGAPFHAAEKFNREVLGMATFDLAYADFKSKGYSDEAAFKKSIETTKELTYKSMFDYSTLNKPRFFQPQYAKVILQFKQFSQQMTYLLARSAYEGIGKKYSPEELQDIRQTIKADHNANKPGLPKLTDAELDAAVQSFIKDVKTEARNRLGGTLGMTFVFAGATGLPLWSVLSSTMNALQAVFGEDDEEEIYDFNNWFKNWSAKTFGGFVGDALSRGVAGQVIGADLSSRMSLNDLWYRDPRKSADEVDFVQNLMISLLGPSVGLVINGAEAVKQFNDGHIQRAMETASPAVIKNVMKGMRYEVEGRAVNLKGDELVADVSGYEAMVQGLGFAPERIAQAQKANYETKSAEQKMLSKRNDLMNAFFMAVDNDDDDLMERVEDKIEKYNNSVGALPITAKALQKSVKTRYTNRALAESTGGIGINKKLIGDLEGMQAYGNPNE